MQGKTNKPIVIVQFQERYFINKEELSSLIHSILDEFPLYLKDFKLLDNSNS